MINYTIIREFMYKVTAREAATRPQDNQPPEAFCKKCVPKSFAKFLRKTPVPEFLTLVFTCKFCENFKNTLLLMQQNFSQRVRTK